jgi:hypothetical protein
MMPGSSGRHGVYLEGDETGEMFLQDDWENMSIPKEMTEDDLAEVARGIIFAGNGVGKFFKGKFYNYIETGGSELPGMPWGGEIKEMGFHSFPKVSPEIIKLALRFFQQVYDKHKSEAYLSLWYNGETEEWKIYVPKQDVSGGGVDYEEQCPPFEGFEYIGDIHSHGSMGASHSATDDKDEFRDKFRAGLHITLGSFASTDARPSWSARYIWGPCRMEKQREEDIVDYGYDVEVPDDWMNQVEKKEFKSTHTRYTGGKTVNTVHGTTPGNLHRTGFHTNSGVKKQGPELMGMEFADDGNRSWLVATMEDAMGKEEEETSETEAPPAVAIVEIPDAGSPSGVTIVTPDDAPVEVAEEK